MIAVMTTTPVAPGRAFRASVIAMLCHLAIGTVGLFFVFLMAYGFAEEMHGPARGLPARVRGRGGASRCWPPRRARWSARLPWRAALRLAASTTAAAYGLAHRGRIVISMLERGRGSVSADQADWPFVLVAAAAASALGAGLAGPAARHPSSLTQLDRHGTQAQQAQRPLPDRRAPASSAS